MCIPEHMQVEWIESDEYILLFSVELQLIIKTTLYAKKKNRAVGDM